MTTRLYVGNLPYSFTDDDLRSLFASSAPPERAFVVIDKMSGRSKGFGFVDVSDDLASSLVATFSGHVALGRALTVNVARPMAARLGGFGGRQATSDLPPAPAAPSAAEAPVPPATAMPTLMSPERTASPAFLDVPLEDLPPTVTVWIDPGSASPELIAELLSAFSDLHRAHGG